MNYKDDNEFIYTSSEIDDLIELFCIPIWEAKDEAEIARYGFALSLVIDYLALQKRKKAKMEGVMDD